MSEPGRSRRDRPILADRNEDVVGIANALSILASVTNGPASPADATYKTAKSDEMYRIPSKQVPTVAERNERVGGFLVLRPKHAVGRKRRSAKSSAGSTLDHRRYVRAQVIAARSEAFWTPRSTE